MRRICHHPAMKCGIFRFRNALKPICPDKRSAPSHCSEDVTRMCGILQRENIDDVIDTFVNSIPKTEFLMSLPRKNQLT